MNEKLKVEIEADIKGLQGALNKADKLLQQHERNYKSVQTAISGNTKKNATVREFYSAIKQ